jgi:hypothetical protein
MRKLDEIIEKFKRSSYGLVWVVAAVMLVILVLLALLIPGPTKKEAVNGIENATAQLSVGDESTSPKKISVTDNLSFSEDTQTLKIYKTYLPDVSANIDNFFSSIGIKGATKKCDSNGCIWSVPNSTFSASYYNRYGWLRIRFAEQAKNIKNNISFSGSDLSGTFSRAYNYVLGLDSEFSVLNTSSQITNADCYNATRVFQGTELISDYYDQHMAQICFSKDSKLTYLEMNFFEAQDADSAEVTIKSEKDSLQTVGNSSSGYKFMYDSDKIYDIKKSTNTWISDQYGDVEGIIFPAAKNCEVDAIKLKYTFTYDVNASGIYAFPVYVANCNSIVNYQNKDYTIGGILIIDAKK